MIYAIADMHGNLPDIPEDAKLVILGGDMCPDSYPFQGDRGVYAQSMWLDGPFRDWMDSSDADFIGIWGNHDFVGEKPDYIPDLPWTLLQDSATKWEDLTIWGTPWVPNLARWAFYASERALYARAAAIPEGIDILVTHGPPYRVLDYCPGGHVGDLSLNEAIKRAGPRVVICGHIHESRGTARFGSTSTIVHNVSMVDGAYVPYEQAWTRIAS